MRSAQRFVTYALLGSLVAACSPGKPADAEEKSTSKTEELPLVKAQKIERRMIQQKIETTSYLEAEHRVTVLSRVTGRILSVHTDEGRKVRKNEILAVLDNREVQASLEQIRVQLAEKKVRKELAILEAEAAAHRESQAETELRKAEKDLQRLQQLDPELVSPKEIEDAQYERSKQADALKVAQFNTRKAKLDVGVAEQAVKDFTAKESEKNIQAKEHEILAPISGVVSMRYVKGGEAITTATELFEVVDTTALIAYLDRPQRELALVEKAKDVLFTTDAYPNRTFAAAVDLISPVVDRGTGSFRIRIRVKSDDAASLRPGLFISAEILTEDKRSAIMIPKTAVLADGDDSIIYYVRDPLSDIGKARRLKLDTGIEDDTAIECRNRGARALKDGDLVIVSGHQDLKDQAQVQLAKD